MKRLLAIALIALTAFRVHAGGSLMVNESTGVIQYPTNFLAANAIQTTNLVQTLSNRLYAAEGVNTNLTNRVAVLEVSSTNFPAWTNRAYVELGLGASASNQGIAIGRLSSAGLYCVAIGDQAQCATTGFQYTVEIGRGNAVSNGWMHYRGHPIVDSNGRMPGSVLREVPSHTQAWSTITNAPNFTGPGTTGLLSSTSADFGKVLMWNGWGTVAGNGDFMKDGSIPMSSNLNLGANLITNGGARLTSLWLNGSDVGAMTNKYLTNAPPPSGWLDTSNAATWSSNEVVILLDWSDYFLLGAYQAEWASNQVLVLRTNDIAASRITGAPWLTSVTNHTQDASTITGAPWLTNLNVTSDMDGRGYMATNFADYRLTVVASVTTNLVVTGDGNDIMLGSPNGTYTQNVDHIDGYNAWSRNDGVNFLSRYFLAVGHWSMFAGASEDWIRGAPPFDPTGDFTAFGGTGSPHVDYALSTNYTVYSVLSLFTASPAWSATNHPTTLSGYGITDAATAAQGIAATNALAIAQAAVTAGQLTTATNTTYINGTNFTKSQGFVTQSVTNGLQGAGSYLTGNGFATTNALGMVFSNGQATADGSGVNYQTASLTITPSQRWSDYSVYLTSNTIATVSVAAGYMVNIAVAHSTSNQVITWPSGCKFQTTGFSASDTNTTGFTDFYGIWARGTNATLGTVATNIFKLSGAVQ